MQTAIVIFLAVLLLAVLWRRGRKQRPTGGNAANTDAELESLCSLLGDNSGRRKS